MHFSRCTHCARRVLLRAVEALIQGRRLTLIDVARAWPDAERIRALLKALDRLLGNRHLHADYEQLNAAIARWLLRGRHPVIVLDWCNLKADQRWHLLHAAVPVIGRTLTISDMVFPDGQGVRRRQIGLVLVSLWLPWPPFCRSWGQQARALYLDVQILLEDLPNEGFGILDSRLDQDLVSRLPWFGKVACGDQDAEGTVDRLFVD